MDIRELIFNILFALVFTLIGTFLSVLSGFQANFWFLTNFLKNTVPKIDIASQISEREINDVQNFVFKVVNKTGYDIFDVSVELTLIKPINATNGVNLMSRDIRLVDNYFAYLLKEDVNDIYNKHALQFRTKEDLHKIWEDPSAFLRLTVVSKHSLSGLSKVTMTVYTKKSDIIKGSYNPGNDTNIKAFNIIN